MNNDKKDEKFNFDNNYGKENIKSLTEGSIPTQSYRLIEFKHGSGQKVPIPSKEALSKTIKMLLDD